jgi:aspartate/methionine/tyrosine aminotransferase
MKIKPFELERYFAKYEFSVKYLLSSSDCDGLPQAEVLSWADKETKHLWENLKLGYTESLGLPLLRQEIAKMYKGVSANDVLITVPEEGIFVALNTLLDKGDQVICTWPGYQSLYEIVESLGCELVKWQPSEKSGWKFDVNFLEEKIKLNTKLIIFNFPHNPTGYLPPKKDFQKIIEVANKRGIHVFSDEMYRFLELNPADRLPSASEVYENAISLFGMSKTFGMAGVRLGWVITKDKALYQKMAAFKDYTTICPVGPSELLSLIALRAKEKIIERHLNRISKNFSLLDDFFQRHGQLFSWVRPKAGTIGFPKILFSENSLKFCERVVNDAGIMILPSTVYGYDDKHFRVGFGRENMPEALAEFEKYLKNNPPKK